MPKLVGIQRAVAFRLGDGSEIRSVPEDEERLTRAEVTSTVHYLKFPFGEVRREARERGPATIVVDHPNYTAEAGLSDEQRAELAADLAG